MYTLVIHTGKPHLVIDCQHWTVFEMFIFSRGLSGLSSKNADIIRVVVGGGNITKLTPSPTRGVETRSPLQNQQLACRKTLFSLFLYWRLECHRKVHNTPIVAAVLTASTRWLPRTDLTMYTVLLISFSK